MAKQQKVALGIAFHGSPNVELDVAGSLAEVASQQALHLTRFSHARRELEDDPKDADVFPVVSFGLSYRF